VLAAVDAPRAGATAVALPADVATAPARSLEPLLADKSESKAVDVAPSRLKSKRLAGADGKRAKDMRVTRANPVAACTASFFQSFCVTRRCTEPRYKNHPKCVRLREEQLAHANRVP
jgi:hypothetical protein